MAINKKFHEKKVFFVCFFLNDNRQLLTAELEYTLKQRLLYEIKTNKKVDGNKEKELQQNQREMRLAQKHKFQFETNFTKKN